MTSEEEQACMWLQVIKTQMLYSEMRGDNTVAEMLPHVDTLFSMIAELNDYREKALEEEYLKENI